MRAILGAAVVLVFGTIVAIATTSKPVKDDLDLIKDYRSWYVASKSVVDLTPTMMLLCRAPYKWEMAPNPHTRAVFRVYVNSVGKSEMMKRGKPKFPDGTVIVKEKFDRGPGYDSLTPDQISKIVKTRPELLTVMVMEAGTWRYFAVGADGKVVNEGVEKCVKCHEVAKEGDYVFRPYVPGAPTMPKF